MKYIDFNILGNTPPIVHDMASMSETLGYSGLVISGLGVTDHQDTSSVNLFSRRDILTKRLPVLKREVAKQQNKYLVLAIPLGDVEIANWAAEDPFIDLLTLLPSEKERLRKTTARLAAKNDTALEVPIHPLLRTQGLFRSKALRIMTDAIKTAMQCEMKVILSSGASAPIHLRSPYAMVHIGMFLGLSRARAIESISDHPLAIIKRNMRKLDTNFIRPGLEIIGEDQ